MELAAPVRPDGSSHAAGFAAVVVVHAVVGYALLTGLAQKVVDAVRAPIDARLIEEIKPPPPPPPEIVKQPPPPKRMAPPPPFVPPPEVKVAAPPPAPTIAAVTPVAPPAPVEIRPEPPAPPAPPAPVVAVAPPPAPPKAESVAIGIACPTMVKPVMPRRAEQEGLGGIVRAQATIRNGKVVSVEILSSKPRGLFDSAVRTAMLQYGCQATGADEVIAQQTFEFRASE